MKRVISLVLVLLLCVSVLAACGDESDGGTASNGSSVGGSTEKVEFIKDGASVYRIIRNDGVQESISCAQFLFQQMKKALGVNVRNTSDTEAGDDMYEILVGDVNRPEVKTAKEYLETNVGGRYEDGIIITVGKKIVIFTENTAKLKDLCEYFVNTYVKTEGVEGGILYTKAAEGSFSSVKVNGIEVGKFDFVRQHFNASYLTEVEMQEISDAILKKTGYKMRITHDTLTASNPAKYEVIVGNTTRDGVQKIANYDEYNIKIAGEKIYINGGSAHSTAIAVSEFGKMLEKGDVTDKNSVEGASYEQTMATYDKTTEFYKTWGDDFDGDEIDTTKWRIMGKGDSDSQGLNGKTSIRSNDPNDVFVSDGKFYICAKQDDLYYYGGMLRTDRGVMSWKYGFLETSMQVPYGDGFWIAIWTQSEDSQSSVDPNTPTLASPEIDIVECFGNAAYYEATCHSWPTNTGENDYAYTHLNPGDGYYCPDDGVKLSDGFHTYGYLWDDKAISFTCDGDLFYTLTYGDDAQMVETYNHSMFLILSMAVGFANCPGGKITDNSDDWQNTNKFVTDWVNIYQKDDGLHQLTVGK